MTDFLNRSMEIGATTGRTMSGVAVPWDTVAEVQDRPGGPRYLEAFAPTSTDVTRSQHKSFPLFAGHDHGTEPLGVVTFSRSEEALMFDATASKTPRGDDHLALAVDGAMRSVSIQFRPIKAANRSSSSRQPITYRTEVALRHLALCPTGYGQYEGAVVDSIRSEILEEEELEEKARTLLEWQQRRRAVADRLELPPI